MRKLALPLLVLFLSTLCACAPLWSNDGQKYGSPLSPHPNGENVAGEVSVPLDPPPPGLLLSETADDSASAYYFETPILGSAAARLSNISLACRAIDGLVLKGGEVFSFNDVVGPRTAERGYLPAPIIKEEYIILEEGGGVCQVSTTLYNAALLAGLDIVESHRHSRPVEYIEEGRDAAVYYGEMDLKLLNDLGFPVMLKMGASSDTIYAGIYPIL